MDDYQIIKLLIADDHELILDGISDMIKGEADLRIIGKARNGQVLLDMLSVLVPDVILMDIEMPEMDGLASTLRISQQYAGIKILMLTQHNSRGLVSAAINNGVHGYLLKTVTKNKLLEGIRAVHRGEFYTAGVSLSGTYSDDIIISSLTPREREIICLIVQEKSARMIASELHLSTNTVNQHLKNIRSKIGVKTVVGIVNYAYDNQLCKSFMQ